MSLTADERRVLEALNQLEFPELGPIAELAELNPVAARRTLDALEARTPALAIGTDNGEKLSDRTRGVRVWTILPAGQEALGER